MVGTQHALFLGMDGKLQLNPAGHWEIVDDVGGRVPLSPKDEIELFVFRRARWVPTRIECRGGTFYATAGIPLYTGQPARFPEPPNISLRLK